MGSIMTFWMVVYRCVASVSRIDSGQLLVVDGSQPTFIWISGCVDSFLRCFTACICSRNKGHFVIYELRNLIQLPYVATYDGEP